MCIEKRIQKDCVLTYKIYYFHNKEQTNWIVPFSMYKSFKTHSVMVISRVYDEKYAEFFVSAKRSITLEYRVELYLLYPTWFLTVDVI